MYHAQRVLKSSVEGTWVNKMHDAEMADSAETLEERTVENNKFQRMELYRSVNWVIEFLEGRRGFIGRLRQLVVVSIQKFRRKFLDGTFKPFQGSHGRRP